MQGHPALRWGTQLLLEALRQVVRAAEVTREHVLVVAADSERIAQWYMDHGFQPTQAADGRRLHMKVATARKQVAAYDRQFRRVSP
jgi:ribosomal protein S18 acetylase RimI-like enzyme